MNMILSYPCMIGGKTTCDWKLLVGTYKERQDNDNEDKWNAGFVLSLNDPHSKNAQLKKSQQISHCDRGFSSQGAVVFWRQGRVGDFLTPTSTLSITAMQLKKLRLTVTGALRWASLLRNNQLFMMNCKSVYFDAIDTIVSFRLIVRLSCHFSDHCCFIILYITIKGYKLRLI